MSVLVPLAAWLATCALLQGCGSSPPAPAPPGTIEILTPAGENVIAVDATVNAVGAIGAYTFTEGAVWIPAPHNVWIWSDIPADKMRQFDGSAVTDYRNPSNKTNGNIWHKGKLLSCEHVGRAVVYTDVPFDQNTREEVVTEFNSGRLNSPNDVAIGKGGAMYFTDPGYGASPVFGHGQPLDQEFRNLFRYDETTGNLVSLWRTVDGQPNGVVFNKDFTRLYLSDSGDLAKIMVFDVSADGMTLSNEQDFATCTDGVPDGMAMDALENLWVACGKGAEIFSNDGTRIAKINTPEGAGNLAFGGMDGQSLMITASSSVWLVATLVREMERDIGNVVALV